MGVNDLFYSDKATLMVAIPTKPNTYGIVEPLYEIVDENVPVSITPISTYHSQQKYGVNSEVSFEISMDYIENCESVNRIVVENVPYTVKNFTIYPAFMCLPKSITYGLKR
ncbi:hypothetical protein GMB34_05140 [Turicibacter sanguinis]|jgi:hypothetical protein|nr:hypothetical protein [Turicibacter sanguinis]DAN56648.1 MAG TPA: hypothetical protein [Caudoviricetes sp.]MTN83025.1 hypothetical protein [Turicibacter sanguinis]MTN86199.1 hypothetical protein [Turicibacter sanguinis]MTN89296.1 hypothetical protein [Turicibacter sanguinis]